jgi:sigma-B regulation protein RsbU (phosphoserine phosphatase)
MVGGDYFDFIPVSDRQIALSLGDVSGKGLPASLLMANVQATLRGQTLVNTSARECITKSNKLLYQSTSSEKFVTLFYGILNHQAHTLEFTNAGQDPPFLLSAGKDPTRLRTGGIVLGIMEEFPFAEDTIQLEAGDLLVIYSDGIPEAINPSKEQFGEEKLCALLQEHHAKPAAELINVIVAAVKEHAGTWPQSDDMTLLVVKRNPA